MGIEIREQKLHMNILFALFCLTLARASVHNLLWDMEPPSLHQLSIHEHVSQADKKSKKLETNWASQLADFLAQNKQFVRNLLKRGKAGMKYRLKSSDLEPKKLIPKLVVTKSSFL